MVKKMISLFSIGVVFMFLGCAHEPQSSDINQLQEQIAQKDQAIKELEAKQEMKEAELAEYQKKVDEQYRAALASEKELPAGELLLPPDAKPGECYARVFIPPTYKTVTETMLKRGASEQLEVIPAKYEWVEEQVLVSEASQRLEVEPAQYEWVEESIVVKEASSRMEEIPAQYEWQEEQVLVKPAQTVWKKGTGPIERIDNATGEIMCLVEIPAVYETVKKKVMVSPPATREIPIPAEYETVKKQVMVKPPTTRTIEIPAVYKTVKVKKMVSPAEERKIEIPAEYQTITKTEMVTDGRMEWREVLCETNMSPDCITKLQRALLNAGHNPGPIDGVFGWRTEAAMKSYQKEKGLAVGALTNETMKSLGIAPTR